MSTFLIRGKALLRGAPTRIAWALALQALVAGLLLAAASRRSPLLGGTLTLLMAACLPPLWLGGLIGGLLPRLPGLPLLRPQLRPLLWQLGGCLLSFQWLVLGLPVLLLLWPFSPLLALVAAMALPVGVTVLPLAWQVLLPERSWTWLIAGYVLYMAVGQTWLMQHTAPVTVADAASVSTGGVLLAGLLAAVAGLALWLHLIARLCAPALGLAPWHAKDAASSRSRVRWGAGSLQQLMLPAARPGALVSRLGIPPALAESAGMALVFVALWFGNRNAGTSVFSISLIWIMGASIARWNQSLWLSPWALLLPGGLRRRQLLPGLVRQALRDHARSRGLLPYLLGLLAALLSGFPLADGLLLAVPATAASLVGLAAAVSFGARRGWPLGTGASVALGSTIFIVACQVAVPWLRDYIGAPPAGRPAVDARLALLAATTLAIGVAVLLLSVALNARRWRQADWQQMPPLPAFAQPGRLH